MDLGMPFAQREAWVKLKKMADYYEQVTGNEVVCVTTYTPMQSLDEPQLNQDPLADYSTSVHGHGHLLKLVTDGLEIAKRNNNSLAHGSFDSSNGYLDNHSHSQVNGKGSNSINISTSTKPYQNGTHHDQSVARSLCSSYRSLRLDPSGEIGFSSYMQQQKGGIEEENESFMSGKTPRSSKKRSQRKNSSRSNQENLELDENLLFGEESFDGGINSGADSDDESTDMSENSYERPPTLFTAHKRPTVGFGQPSNNRNANFAAASLPVTINSNWGGRQDSEVRFRDNQGPHPPLQYVKAKPPLKPGVIASNISHTHQNSQDTPNPETMMASMQALARSVTNDSALIFGERPRPRLNTGESTRINNRIR